MKVKKGGRNWKRLALLVLPLLVIIMIGIRLGGASIDSAATSRNSVLLSINGIEIPEEEFRMFLQDEKASTANYFSQTYGAEYNEHFWDTDFEGENPVQVARENALSKLIRVKTEQQLAVQYGVIRSASYDHIKKQMNKEENQYGAESLDGYQKYMVYHSKLVVDAKNNFKVKAVSIPESELRQYYELNKENRFKLPDQVEALVISLPGQDLENVGEVIPNLIDEIRGGAKVDELKKKYFSQYGFVIKHKQYGSDEGKDENSSELEDQLKEIANELSTGQTSAPTEISGQTYVVVCLERNQEKVSTFDEAKLWIEDVLQDERFMQQVENDSGNQVMYVNEEWFNQIRMN
ncbi:peptidylprolyl isomerase [Paenibacillus endoradicis]|uniref:peptidylprolyl isomerase n=1 Tax=Paenibacillus endoradicis TaxID=2972487 RepID=UPI002158EF72|nr:peptidylprolyl isomerase [Paenibacillus endoradicis]MCR8660419.1 peptidyl-prolyl cis-trans isomerase [Paenibacillus endoradicis]